MSPRAPPATVGQVTTNYDANGDPGGRDGQPWWLRPQVWAALLVIAAIGMSMLLAGCGSGGNSSPPSVGSKKYQEALAFVQCMRTHGEPTFPDPTSKGIISDSQLNPGSQVLLQAGRACGSLLPPGSLQLTEAQQEQIFTAALRRSACMRAHGVINFPDPTSNGLRLGGTRIDPASPVFHAAARACNLSMGSGRAARP